MEKRLFADLVTSLEEAAAISRGKARPARQFKVAAPEQKRCVPTGPAAALLEIVAAAPDVALKALHR